MKHLLSSAAVIVLLAGAFLALPAAAEEPDNVINRLLDRIVAREKSFLGSVQTHTPLIETYIQETPEAKDEDAHPVKDHYFLGRFRIHPGIEYLPLIERTDARRADKINRKHPANAPAKVPALTFLPRGFAQMTVIDSTEFNRDVYHFEYVRREFLGEVRCLVFDVAPIQRAQPGKFIGRIWVEDHDDTIVRFNGTYIPVPAPKGTTSELYFHFDSWRVNTGSNNWVPAQIYIEEEENSTAEVPRRTPRFKAQSRIWDYASAPTNKMEELTSILIEGDSPLHDQDVKDNSPLESQRNWERQAEENLLARLEKGGLLSPPGPVDDVLNTVVNNLIVSANLNIDARCRVLLSSPIETFAIGHTIVISRGLIDVLPDEASLGLLLASELSHIALGHRTQTQFAFHNQTMLSDAELLQRFRFGRPEDEMAAAGRETIEIMKASPYQNTSNAGLFLKALAARNQALPMLLKANLGDQVADERALARLADFANAAPPLEENKIEQIAALPLGSRIKMNPWSNHIEMVKTRPLSLLSAREKMPFEVTPFVLNLTRADRLSKDALKEAAKDIAGDAAKEPAGVAAQ